MLAGVDVSNWQGAAIDWAAVAAAGYKFAIVKRSEGTTFADPTFVGNWAGLSAAGMLRGAYHFAQPDETSPEAEAVYFASLVHSFLAPGDVLALDLEAGKGDLSAWVLAFLQRVEQLVGFKPLLYSSAGFLADHGCATAAIAEYGLWLAAWQPTAPAAPAPWPFWAVWQTSASGRVDGIPGQIDIDQFNGTADQFRAYGLPQPTPTPPVPPTPVPPDPTPPAPLDTRTAVAQIAAELVSAALDPGITDADALADADTAERQLYTLLYQAGLRKARKG